MNKENGGPAFPLCVEVGENIHLNVGMTLRDYFAAKAMQGIVKDWSLMSCPDGSTIADPNYAKHCYKVADAMLKARGE